MQDRPANENPSVYIDGKPAKITYEYIHLVVSLGSLSKPMNGRHGEINDLGARGFKLVKETISDDLVLMLFERQHITFVGFETINYFTESFEVK